MIGSLGNDRRREESSMTANHVRMRGRDASEEHRGASSLELLFDLTFVVAIAQLALQLSHGGDEVTGPEKIGPYLMVFFAIWWAWISFTWFASAYDTDDVLYRVFAVVQMAGVLVLAAGVPAAFADGDFRAIALGYLVMRIGLVAHWVRVAVEHPGGRATALRYITGIAVAQLGWLVWLLLPRDGMPLAFLVLVAIELSVPVWAERRGKLSWHPGHIAERYGLFVILLLGESVLAATNGARAALVDGGVTADLVVISLAGLVLLVGLWWTYFLDPRRRGSPPGGRRPSSGGGGTSRCSRRWPRWERGSRWRSWPCPTTSKPASCRSLTVWRPRSRSCC